MSEGFKNVLIVGVGIGGLGALKSLSGHLPPDYRVVALQESEFAYNPIASLRAATVPGWEDRIPVPINDNVFENGSRHIILSGTQAVEFSPHSIKVNKASTEFGFVIPFKFAVIATGANHNFPCRAPEFAITEDDVKTELRRFQEEIAEAQSVLVVGGGPAGVEFVGEVSKLYPHKKITLLHPHSRLFAQGWKKVLGSLGDRLMQQVDATNVKTYYDCRLEFGHTKSGRIATQTFDLGNGESVKADFVFIAFGSTPTSHIIQNYAPALVNSNGAIRVKPTLQIESADSSLDHVFAVGDVNDVAENKLAGASYLQGRHTALNIVQFIKNKEATLKTWSPSGPHGAILFGFQGGAGEAFGWTFGRWLAQLSTRNLGTWKFKSAYGTS